MQKHYISSLSFDIKCEEVNSYKQRLQSLRSLHFLLVTFTTLPVKAPLSLFIFCLFYTVAQGQSWTQTTGATSCFSSARAADLNLDGVKDLVIGGGLESIFDADGNIIQYPSDHMVMALDGATGEWLWQVEGMDQIFSSPTFMDINFDGRPEVFIGGRNGYLLCIDGATGTVSWQFYEGSAGQNAGNDGLYNFFNLQLIPDQNNDGFPELLTANGGDRELPSFITDRPAGKLMVIDPIDGALLASAEMPDGKETYMSPLVHDFFRDKKPEVIFGTGGETIGGGLYRVPLSDLMAGDISNAHLIVSRPSKGFIAPPSLADLTSDNIPEIIVNTYDGYSIAYDGWTNEQLWSHNIEGAETNCSPAIGLFTDDDIPDVFTSFLIGTAPVYNGAVQILLDGATGELLYQSDLGANQYSSPVVYDFNTDGRDEAVFTINMVNGDGTFSHDVLKLDFTDESTESLIGGPKPGTNIASTPYLGPLNNDGLLDLFYTHNTDPTEFNSKNGVSHQRLTVAAIDTNAVAWGGYMGNYGNGKYDNPLDNCFQTLWSPVSAVTPPTCTGGTNGEAIVSSNGCPCQFNDCIYEWDNGDTTKHAYNLAAGEHFLQLTHEDGCKMVIRVTVPESSGPENIQTNVSCNGGNDGYLQILDTFVNDSTIITYTSYNWSTGETTPSISNLSAGEYSVNVVSSEGCEETVYFTVAEPEPIEVFIDIASSCEQMTSVTAAFAVLAPSEVTSFVVDGFPYPYSDGIELAFQVGTHTGVVTTADGCSKEFSFGITGEAALDVDAQIVSEVLCVGGNANVELTIDGGEAPFYYLLDGVIYPLGTENTYTLDFASGSYVLEVTDAAGCSNNVVLELEEPTPLSISGETTASTGNDGSLVLNISGGSGSYVVDWGDLALTAIIIDGEMPSAMGLAPGEYAVIVADANNCTAAYSFTIEEDLTGLDDIVTDFAVQVFPNPNKGQFSIRTNINVQQAQFNVYDAQGRLQHIGNNTRLLDAQTVQIDLGSGVQAGVYFVEVVNENERVLQKLVVME